MNSPASQAVFVERGGVLPRRELVMDVRNVGPGIVFEGDRWNVSAAIGVHMEPFLQLLVYRVDCGALSVVFATDTKPCKPPIELACDADVWVLTCWDHQRVVDRSAVGDAMSGTIDVARMAQ